jgi:NADPH:quinone reductase
MDTVTVTEFGPPDVLRLTPASDPVRAPGQVLIDVAVADVLWVETAIRAGAGTEWFDIRPPYVPGGGVAGTVVEADDPALVGQRVLAHLPGQLGGYATRAVADAGATVPLPDEVKLTDGAALLHDAVTALALVERTNVLPDDAVLVLGASGGLGIALVQLARDRGARVVATGRDAAKLARIRALGADVVIDTDRPGWVDAAREAIGGRGADVVLDNIGGPLGASAFELVATGGRFSAHGTPGGSFTAPDAGVAARRGITLLGIADVQLSGPSKRRLLTEAVTLAAAGRLRPVIGQTFALTAAAEAHKAIEARTVFGKTLLLADPS